MIKIITKSDSRIGCRRSYYLWDMSEGRGTGHIDKIVGRILWCYVLKTPYDNEKEKGKKDKGFKLESKTNWEIYRKIT